METRFLGRHLATLERALDECKRTTPDTIAFLLDARGWARLPDRYLRQIEREHIVVVAASVLSD